MNIYRRSIKICCSNQKLDHTTFKIQPCGFDIFSVERVAILHYHLIKHQIKSEKKIKKKIDNVINSEKFNNLWYDPVKELLKK